MDGLDLATLIAKSDPDPELKAAVVGGMSFRRADRHVAEVLSTADDATFDLVYRNGHLEEIEDKTVQERLAAARARAEKEVSDYERLRANVYARDEKDHGADLIELIGTIEIERKQDAEVGLIYEARNSTRPAVAQGLLKRLREGRELFYGADNILAASGIVVEEDALLEMVLCSARTDGQPCRGRRIRARPGQRRQIDRRHAGRLRRNPETWAATRKA